MAYLWLTTLLGALDFQIPKVLDISGFGTILADQVRLGISGEYNEKVVIFWEALIFLCTGRFFGKQVFLRGSESSLLSSQDRRTLSHLQDFFSNETGFGAEKCNMLFD